MFFSARSGARSNGMRLHFRIQGIVLLSMIMTIVACSAAQGLPAAPTAAITTSPTASANSLPTTTHAASQTQLPSDIANAFIKTRSVRNVRYEITSQVSLLQNGKPQQKPGVHAIGAESGDNRQLALSGIMNATGEAATFEFITLDGVNYIKGLYGIPGINPAQWYRFTRELGNVTHDAPGIRTLLAQLEMQDIQNAAFQNVGSETLDGQSCVIWLARDPKLAEDLLGIAGGTQANSEFQALDQGEFRVWTCADGYMHRIIGSVLGHDPAAPEHQATMELSVHLYDHDAEIIITAPPDARDFQAPVTNQKETPTPEP